MTRPGGQDRWERDALAAYFARRPYTAAQLAPGLTDSLRPPVGPEAREELAARAAALLTAPPEGADRLDVEVVRRTLEAEQEALSVPWHDYTVSALPEAGLSSQTLLFLPYADLGGPDAVEQYASMCARVPVTLAEAVEALERGTAAGRCPVADLLPAAIAQVETYLASPIADDVFLDPLRRRRPDAADRLEETVRREIRPAFEVYADTVRSMRPHARPGERAGLCWIADGEEYYVANVREFTTLDVAPDWAHDLGLTLVEDLQAEVEGVARALGWEPSARAVLDRLRTDPGYRFASRQDVLAAARSALERARQRTPDWVGYGLAEAPCEVLPMTALEERSGVLGHYEVAPLDRSRPARYWVNTGDPGSRFTFEAEALAFHEAVPGHHVELTASARADHGSPFRQAVGVMPYTEGWALYAERLAEEMGLYSGPTDRLGMLSFALWRAARLVVDTGIHAFGWPRARAVSYLEAHTALSAQNIANEVDRYIAHPGSALAYQLGERTLRALRDRVDGDDCGAIREFHETLLAAGPLPLPLLAESFGASTDSLLQALS